MSASDPPDAEEQALREAIQQGKERARAWTMELDADEREKLRAAHYMRCAKCGHKLTEVEFRGVKVDKCFACGGVYLDDGELEQLAGRQGWFERFVSFFGS